MPGGANSKMQIIRLRTDEGQRIVGKYKQFNVDSTAVLKLKPKLITIMSPLNIRNHYVPTLGVITSQLLELILLSA